MNVHFFVLSVDLIQLASTGGNVNKDPLGTFRSFQTVKSGLSCIPRKKLGALATSADVWTDVRYC